MHIGIKKRKTRLVARLANPLGSDAFPILEFELKNNGIYERNPALISAGRANIPACFLLWKHTIPR